MRPNKLDERTLRKKTCPGVTKSSDINFFFEGFVDFDDYEAVDLVVSQREHFIEGHRMRVELALPMVNDSLYEKDVVVPGKDALGFHVSC